MNKQKKLTTEITEKSREYPFDLPLRFSPSRFKEASRWLKPF
jgi:hypothetical protein